MTTLTITRGLPGSGKTTWARAQPDAVRVNRDELRRMLHGGHTGSSRAERQVTIAHRALIAALLGKRADVICDDTNLHDKAVRELTALAHDAGAQVEIRDFTSVPLEACLERDAARPAAERVGPAVILDMYRRYLAGGGRGRSTVDQPRP